jgi:hypothetical protein
MSRLTIDISPEQHKSLKAMAALEGKTIRQYTLERLFPRGNEVQRSTAQRNEMKRSTAEPTEAPGPHRLRFPEDEAYEQALREGRRVITLGSLLDKPEAEMDEAEKAAWANFLRFLEQRAEEARTEPLSERTIDDIFEDVMREEGHAPQ